MKNCFIMGAMLLAVVSSAADKVIDLSTPQAWTNKNIAAAGAGTLSATKHGFILVAKDMIPVDDKHTYNFSGTIVVPEGKIAGGSYAGYYLYDANKRYIMQIQASSIPNSTTELTEAVKKGSTVLKVKNCKAWLPGRPYFYVGFNVKDGELSMDNSAGGLKSVKAEGGNLVVTLARPINKDYPAGTKVRLQRSGSYFYSSIVRPGKKPVNFQKNLKKGDFWIKTAFIRPMILVNWGLPAKADKTKVETLYKNMKLTIKEIK